MEGDSNHPVVLASRLIHGFRKCLEYGFKHMVGIAAVPNVDVKVQPALIRQGLKKNLQKGRDQNPFTSRWANVTL